MIYGRPAYVAHPNRPHVYGVFVSIVPKDGSPQESWWECACGKRKDEAAVKRGRTSLRAGKDAERHIAKAYGGTRTGMYGGPDDVLVGDLFIVQSKVRGAFPNWMWTELQKLPRVGGRIPTLIVSDRPGTGHRVRRLTIRITEDDVALHGKDADASEG